MNTVDDFYLYKNLTLKFHQLIQMDIVISSAFLKDELVYCYIVY